MEYTNKVQYSNPYEMSFADEPRGDVMRALDDVSFAVQRGEFVSIMGPSGSGKSTLLNCVYVTKIKHEKLTRFRREQLGFIFQDSNLLDTLTARENIALPLTIARTPACCSRASRP